MTGSKLYALIVAAGSGTRMSSDIPKQFLKVGEKPILMYTIERFHNVSSEIDIVVVLSSRDIPLWKELCKKYDFNIAHQIIHGGHTRGASVLNGLQNLSLSGLVAIHDGVRPFVSEELIQNSFSEAEKYGNAVLCVPLKDSLREFDEGSNKAVERSRYKLVQTPQTFKVDLILNAYRNLKEFNLSDDATVAENAGLAIHLIDGSYDNIKITTQEDLLIAEMKLKEL